MESDTYRMLAVSGSERLVTPGDRENGIYLDSVCMIRVRRLRNRTVRVLVSVEIAHETDITGSAQTASYAAQTLCGAVDAAREHARTTAGLAYRPVIEVLMEAERMAAHEWPADLPPVGVARIVRWLRVAAITIDAWEALSDAGMDVFPSPILGPLRPGGSTHKVEVAQIGAFPVGVTMDLVPDGIGIRMECEPEWYGERRSSEGRVGR